ncbi:hypothetical protein DL98DRAFT_95278 [Cadophora sp. DSE1049]|nr:hypothetical protein DL98DRAFT_95278 [Cadophora sp. DSE1049]
MLIATPDRNDSATPETGPLTAKSLGSDIRDSSRRQIIIHEIPTLVADNGRPKRGSLIPPLLAYTTDASLGLSEPTIVFPLSPDHHLITLVQYNVVRALILNMSILSLLYCLPDKCSRAFGISATDIIPPENISEDLQPTLLQQSIPHPFWISAIPFPAMRDNLILLAGTYDSDDLCYDLGQALYEGFDDVERRGFLVWGDPWQMSGWKVTEGFVRKWGFLLKGCLDVVESANRWRDARGEDMLAVET